MMEDYGCWAKKRGDGKFDAFKARYFVVTGAVVDYYAGPKTEGPIDAPTLAASYEVKGSIALAEVSDFADGAAFCDDIDALKWPRKGNAERVEVNQRVHL